MKNNTMHPTQKLSVSLTSLLDRFAEVRSKTEELCGPLEIEDYVIQATPEVSPPKWHLAHTNWFFDTFLLQRFVEKYRQTREQYGFLFNSYYQTVGKFFSKNHRGLLSRPTVQQILDYRAQTNKAVALFLNELGESAKNAEVKRIVEIGIQHEQQHQELLLMDIKYNFGFNPLKPAYFPSEVQTPLRLVRPEEIMPEQKWVTYDGGECLIGAQGDGFHFDNEYPAHSAKLEPFALSNRLVTNGEYLEFVDSGGYEQPEWWLSDGWDHIKKNAITHPLYWRKENGWKVYTLWGELDIREGVPVCHLSFYEADAYSRWKGARLPTELEWEFAAKEEPMADSRCNFMEKNIFHPVSADRTRVGRKLFQCYGDLWEWTQSAYLPYPGYRTPEGAIGEYNGKFMCNQKVVRGGCCVTPVDHVRTSYRNFYYPHNRWPFVGLRLARNWE